MRHGIDSLDRRCLDPVFRQVSAFHVCSAHRKAFNATQLVRLRRKTRQAPETVYGPVADLIHGMKLLGSACERRVLTRTPKTLVKRQYRSRKIESYEQFFFG